MILEAQFSDTARSRPSLEHEIWLEAAKLVLTDAKAVEIARHLRALAEHTIRPQGRA